MFYLDIDASGDLLSDEAKNAIRVACHLDAWMSLRNTSDVSPRASVTISGGCLSISLGDVCVWDSETRDGDEELTVKVCLRNYRQYIDDLKVPFDYCEPTEYRDIGEPGICGECACEDDCAP